MRRLRQRGWAMPPRLTSLVGLVLVLAGPLAAELCQAQMPPALVVVTPVVEREINVGQTFVGTVMPIRASTVGSSIEARVERLDVDEGTPVKQGQTLAELRSEPLKLELAAARAELQLRREELAALRESLPQEIEQAEARMLASKAVQDFASARLRRNQALFATRSVSEDEVQDAISAAEAASQHYRENVAAHRSLVNTKEERIAQAEARALVQEELIRKLEDDLAQHTIVAPFDGYVTKKHSEVGQWVTKGAPIVDVVEVDIVEIEAAVLEDAITHVVPGVTARVQISSLPEQWITAPVSHVVPQGDVRSRTFPVKVRLKNQAGPSGVLFQPGMFARVTLPVGRKSRVLMAPKDAVVLGGETPVVFVADPLPPAAPGAAGAANVGMPGMPTPNAMARMAPVDLGAAEGDWIEVRGPLKVGDRIVIQGNEKLFPGQPMVVGPASVAEAEAPAVGAPSSASH